MKIIKRIRNKIYCSFRDFVLPQVHYHIPCDMKKYSNLFIYFDYEREFGGCETYITDVEIYHLLKKLEKLEIKTTWFTVGKIFEKYPYTITAIKEGGHEIASHTYNHIQLTDYSPIVIRDDFKKFDELVHDVDGFHPPQGMWSITVIKDLLRFNYKYDVFRKKNVKHYIPYKLTFRTKSLCRMHTLGDDWNVYNKNLTEKQVFDYFVSLFNKIKIGELAGIGCHPWVLYSDANILKGFERFLLYIIQQSNVNIKSASQFCNILNNQ